MENLSTSPHTHKQKECISRRLLIRVTIVISELLLWEDSGLRTPAGQMALDEALLLSAGAPVLRFYRWATPAVTFGYAQRFSGVLPFSGKLPAIRRWTGGGTVFHGKDLTLSLAVPEPHPLCRLQPAAIYRNIHSALLRVVVESLAGARLAEEADCCAGPACFQSPARDDLLFDGKKIGGGALRRGRNGILYQGSLHGDFLPRRLADSLSARVVPFQPTASLLALSTELEKGKYGTSSWNQMR